MPDLDVRPLYHRSSPPGDARRTLRTPAHHRLETWTVGLELALARRRFDVYHATDFIAPRFVRGPVVATVHDLAFMRYPDHLSRDSLRHYRQISSQKRRVNHWIAPSRWTRDEMVDLLGIDGRTISVIHHGVSRFAAGSPVLGRDSRRPFVVAVGTVEPRKRYDLLLDAVEYCNSGVELCIVGSPGWNTANLQRRIESADRVTWLPQATDREVFRLVSSAVALLIPSIDEGFGLSALEAMARGTPVISSGRGALPEVTGDAARLPADDSPESWAETIDDLTTDTTAWDALSAAGRQQASSFTWKKAAQKTSNVYRLVAEQ